MFIQVKRKKLEDILSHLRASQIREGFSKGIRGRIKSYINQIRTILLDEQKSSFEMSRDKLESFEKLSLKQPNEMTPDNRHLFQRRRR